jgi:hypothetical protein
MTDAAPPNINFPAAIYGRSGSCGEQSSGLVYVVADKTQSISQRPPNERGKGSPELGAALVGAILLGSFIGWLLAKIATRNDPKFEEHSNRDKKNEGRN